MRAELLEHVGAHIAKPHVPNAKDAAWFEDWDQRLYRARPSCTESERGAFTELNRLRYGLGALAERFEREELPHLDRLDELLGPEPQHARASTKENP
ncbi:MAG: hypothetical protein ABW352_14630 [Polyangiales bacterium]